MDFMSLSFNIYFLCFKVRSTKTMGQTRGHTQTHRASERETETERRRETETGTDNVPEVCNNLIRVVPG